MTLTDNTILITGGSSGIGLEMAKVFTSRKNRVLICGRSAEKLANARKQIPSIETFQSDISIPDEVEALVSWVKKNHPACNILINNAAIVHRTSFYSDDNMIEKARQEIDVNLMAPITLSKKLVPIIEKNANPTIINITTGLVYAPKAEYPIYNATKAGLHAFSQVLRMQLRHTPVQVIEALFSVVDTPWHKGEPPKIAISPEKAVKDFVRKLEKGQEEIKIDKVKLLYLLSRISPSLALKKINQL